MLRTDNLNNVDISKVYMEFYFASARLKSRQININTKHFFRMQHKSQSYLINQEKKERIFFLHIPEVPRSDESL